MNRHTAPFVLLASVLAMGGIANVPADATTLHKIEHVVLDAGNPGRTLSSGYSTIEQATVWCNIYHGNSCTLQMRIMANVGEATCKDEWAIVGLVDGHSVDGGPLLESLPNAGVHQTHIWQGIYTTSTGTHTITFQLYLPCSANLNQWSARYLVTRP